MKTYTITAITKANRTEYFHAVTVEAESVKEAKEKASAIIRATLDRHAFRIANATAPASIEHAQWIASRFNTTVDAVMQAASRPEGVDAYDFEPATVEAEEPEQATEAEPEQASTNDAAAQIVATATDHAAEIARVIGASVDTMKTAAAICANALRSAMSTKSADRLTEIAGSAIAAASAASDANMKAWNDIKFANAEYVSKARRSAAAFAAAATRAAATGDAAKIEAAEAKRDAAAQAVQIVEEAYRAADAARIEGNRAMNAAMKDARAIVNRAKEVAAANRAREIVDRYPETDAETITETVTRELETRFEAINAAISDVSRLPVISDRRAAKAATAAALLDKAEQTRAAMSGTAPTEATKNAAHWADLAEQAAQQVAEAATICDADACDNRAAMYAAAAVDEAARYDADDATDAETARAISAAEQARENLISRVNRGMTEADAEAVESSDYAATLTSEAFTKAGTNHAAARAAFATQAAPDLAKYEGLEFLELEPAPAPTYQRYELEAYIGAENLEDYDVEAIEAEATEYDPATSRTVWRRGIDLATICERHEVAAYYPAAV